jgi:hypothetical protein
MRKSLVVAALIALPGCEPAGPDGATQHRLFLECMSSVVQERSSTHEDHWNRLVDACRAYSYGVAGRIRETGTPHEKAPGEESMPRPAPGGAS